MVVLLPPLLSVIITIINIIVIVHLIVHRVEQEQLGGACARGRVGCEQMGSTLMGPLQKTIILTDWGKRYALALLGR